MKFNLDIFKVAEEMLQAALPALAKGGQKASAYALHEFQQHIINLQHVQTLTEEEKITPQEAQFLTDQYKLSMQAILLTVEGLGIISVQQAINAAIDVLNNAIKASIGAAVKSV